MGLFDSVKNMAKKINDDANRFQEEKKQTKLEEQIRLEKADFERKQWEIMRNDKEYQSMTTKMYKYHEKIEESYSILNSMSAFNDPAGDNFLLQCEKCMTLAEQLLPKWKLYKQNIEYVTGYKRAAMAYEKRGQFEEAANICVRSILSGFPSDGTDSGMRGRLARMIKKGKLTPSDEMKSILLDPFK